MNKKLLKYCLPFLLVINISVFGQDIYTVKKAPNKKTVPNPKTSNNTWVSDPEDVLSLNDKAKLNQLINEIETTSSAEIAVVILPSIGTEVPKMFAVDLFEEWKIGKANTDNGLLILTVMDQRRTWQFLK